MPGLDAARTTVVVGGGQSAVREFDLTTAIYTLQEFKATGEREGGAAAITAQRRQREKRRRDGFAPSGQKMIVVPFPGGRMRCRGSCDAKAKLHWLLSSQATGSMTPADRLPPERYDPPNNKRHRLVLHFSKNMIDWCFAGGGAITGSPKEARHHAGRDIDGDDLVILARSGDVRAKSAHDGNLITFHRVRNFPGLVD